MKNKKIIKIIVVTVIVILIITSLLVVNTIFKSNDSVKEITTDVDERENLYTEEDLVEDVEISYNDLPLVDTFTYDEDIQLGLTNDTYFNYYLDYIEETYGYIVNEYFSSVASGEVSVSITFVDFDGYAMYYVSDNTHTIMLYDADNEVLYTDSK